MCLFSRSATEFLHEIFMVSLKSMLAVVGEKTSITLLRWRDGESFAHGSGKDRWSAF